MTRKDLTAETAPDINVEAEAKLRGLPEYVVRANRAVSDQLMRDIVSDFRRGIPTSASMIPDSKRAEPATSNKSGWVDAPPLKGPDTRWVDAQLDADDQRQRLIAQKQATELAWIEGQLAKDTNKVKSEYNPIAKADREVPSFHRDKEK